MNTPEIILTAGAGVAILATSFSLYAFYRESKRREGLEYKVDRALEVANQLRWILDDLEKHPDLTAAEREEVTNMCGRVRYGLLSDIDEHGLINIQRRFYEASLPSQHL